MRNLAVCMCLHRGRREPGGVSTPRRERCQITKGQVPWSKGLTLPVGTGEWHFVICIRKAYLVAPWVYEGPLTSVNALQT